MKIRRLVPGTIEPAYEVALADALEPDRYIALRPVWVIGPLVAYRGCSAARATPARSASGATGCSRGSSSGGCRPRRASCSTTRGGPDDRADAAGADPRAGAHAQREAPGQYAADGDYKLIGDQLLCWVRAEARERPAR